MSYQARLNNAFNDAPILPLTTSSRYILMSDCHRGNGTSNDNFLKNQNLYFAALQHYYEQGYTYIELGDGDELWENYSMEQITTIHNNIFWLLSRYHIENRLYLLYGNHDIVKENAEFSTKNCSYYYCGRISEKSPLFTNLDYHEGLILKDELSSKNIYLIHGHQADFLNSRLWKAARFLVRYVWRPLENLGFLDPTSAAKNYTKKKKTEIKLNTWAKKENRILIAGHTHRPRLGIPDSTYFNTGSCVHPRCITCIEIENRCFTLVKWTMATRHDMSLYVAREVIVGPVCLDDYEV